MVNLWDKFGLLMWKNFKLQTRHKKQTALEILIPVFFTALLVAVRSFVEPEQRGDLLFDEFDGYDFSLNETFPIPFDHIMIPYSPNTTRTRGIVERAMVKLAKKNNIANAESIVAGGLRAFPNSSSLYAYLSNSLISSNNTVCGIAFDDAITEETSLPELLMVTLHFPSELRVVRERSRYANWYTDFSYPPFQLPGPRQPNSTKGADPKYAPEGFTPIAHALFREMLEGRNISVPEIVMNRFPHPAYLEDILLVVLTGFLPLVFMLSFVYTCINTVKAITTEKEFQLKEVMKVMGLDGWLHWLAWFVKSFSYISITMVLIVILLKVEWYSAADGTSDYSVLTYTPWHFLLFFFLLYTVTTICFCFMISVFFSRANTAATVAGLMWFLSFSPFTFMTNGRTLAPFTSRILGCFASNAAMSFGLGIIMNHETLTDGLQWHAIWTVITEDDQLVMGHILVMLVVDAILYLLVALYVEQVMPGSYGVPKPWYFPFTKTFWCSTNSASVDVKHEHEHSPPTDDFESDPKNCQVGVDITNLTKKFQNNVAVDNLNLKIFEGQITVILGHNGAGKTTTMSMLTGVLPPTSGTAIINGQDVRTNIAGVRSSLGLCPQHNVLFPDLTVEEHVYFFARLKGIKGADLKHQVEKYIRLLGLEDKRHVLSNALSGGMKRRLSVGVALCGDSKVVLLDEPSSGIDPASRRELWNLLQNDKAGRTIILSTHFMDEAEVLGERIAVMAGGRVRAVGSPFFLKRRFNVGYTLTITTSVPAPTAEPNVTTLVKSHIPQAALHSNIGSELSYHLPSEFTQTFDKLFQQLETKSSDYNINSFGVSAGSLEDVFMRVGADAIDTLDESEQDVVKSVNQPDDKSADAHTHREEFGDIFQLRFTGARLWRDQWYAMFYKLAVTTSRSWITTSLRVLLPVIFLVIAILVNNQIYLAEVLPARELSLANGYQDSETIVSHADTQNSSDRARQYERYFTESNIRSMKVTNIGNKSMEEYYLQMASNNIGSMRKRNLVGASFDDDKITVWFSSFALHDLPASLLLVYNSLVDSNSSFSLTNHPVPYTLDTKVGMLDSLDNKGFQVAFNIGFGLAFVSAFFVLFYIKENASRSKLLQLASGASPFILWTSALLWDMLCFLLVSLALIFTLLAFQQENFTTAEQLFRLLLMLLVFGLAMLPLHYLLSGLFEIPSTGFSRMVFFNLFAGIATFLIIQILSFPTLDLQNVTEPLHWIFLIVPHYAISDAIQRHFDGYARVNFCQKACEPINALFPFLDCDLKKICEFASRDPEYDFLKVCCISEDPYFEWETPGVVPHLVFMLVVAVLTFSILLLKEYKLLDTVIQKIITRRGGAIGSMAPDEEDSDVAAERQKVEDMNKETYTDYSLLCKNMSKKYKNFLAVNKISFGVQQGECFGLLGINGAGKTTTFKMLTGDLYTSYGDGWVAGQSVNDNMKSVYKLIGYCPQFDALLDDMTGEETLEMFARLKGIPPAEKEAYMKSLSHNLGFTKHLRKKVREYSGGNKRKLSTAVALLGDPEVVYLDEPTTGMDPVAKRQLWRAVANRSRGCTILTSHSMEECEALCTRLAIMVNGSFRCLGSTQHLKNKFSQGYTLIVKLLRGATGGAQPLHQFLNNHFPGAILKEEYETYVTYYLKDTTMPWSQIFRLMEENKTQLGVEDYSVGQTSLEQIFLQFAKDQH